VEAPIRRPQLPQQAAYIASVLLEAGPTALGVEVMLVPSSILASGGLRSIGQGDVLDVVEASGRDDGTPVVLLHGFPDDPRAYDGALDALAGLGCRVLVPWLRGYGPTRFVDPATPRSGQQAALGRDLLDLIDALGFEQAALAGYDWGGRAACIVAALWPKRVAGLVTMGGYDIQDIAAAAK